MAAAGSVGGGLSGVSQMTAVKFHDCTHNAALTSSKDPASTLIPQSKSAMTKKSTGT